MMESDWYNHPKYQPYWKHYEEMQNWYGQNKEQFWQLLSPAMELSSSPSTDSSRTCVHCSHRHPVNKTTTNTRNDLHSRPRTRFAKPDDQKLEEEEEESDISIEMEISEEMIAFFEHSEKHRQELRALREKEAKESEQETTTEYSNKKKGKNSKKQSVNPPKQRPGVQRTAEMKLLYGKSAAMIHGMETAMQLSFDRNCDIFQPKPWPNIPLNL